MDLIHPLLLTIVIFNNFGTLLLDLISKMALQKERKPRFEVPIAATSIPIVVSGFQMAIRISTTYNYSWWTFSFPNTLKWIVVQKIILHYTIQHNKQKTYQLKKLREKRLLKVALSQNCQKKYSKSLS